MDGVLREGDTYFRRAEVTDLRVWVDARSYYRAFCRAALAARRTLLLSGWQFDTKVRLLRGEDARRAAHPVEFVEFLSWLCERNAELRIYILAWDYSSVYAIEREWLQKLKFAFGSHPRVRFEFWTHPDPGGAHHQKYVVVDDCLAFIGGIDICDARWDDRAHLADQPDRIDVKGNACKPYHDVQSSFSGALVRDVQQLFVDSWERACGEKLLLQPGEQAGEGDGPEHCPSAEQVLPSEGLPIRSTEAVLSRTDFRGGHATAREVKSLLEAAISAAERLVYIETQYFTSRAVLAAFRRRLENPAKRKLVIVIVAPDGGDTPKEDFVLGDRQRAVRFALSRLAADHGHEVHFLKSCNASDPEHPVNTFIHSKLLIVDDEFLTLGSANLTNRSMEVDLELNLSVQCPAESEGSRDIQRLRASLLAEHAAVTDDDRFSSIETLGERLSGACRDPNTRLRCLEVLPPEDEVSVLADLFDPAGAMTFETIERSLERSLDLDDGIVKKLVRMAGQRLGVVDIE